MHRDQAAPGDLADWEPPVLVFGSAGLEQPLTAADKEYYRELHEQREQEQAERNARRQREAEAIEAARERYLREHGGPDIMGVPASKVRVDL